MKISILLPYKENFSKTYAGAVSISIRDTVKESKYKKNIYIYGNTNFKNKLLKNYINIKFSTNFLQSSSKNYILSFLEEESKNRSSLIEMHNRPSYVKFLSNLKYAKKVLYFHNDPLEMSGSRTIEERLFLINNLDKIIFNSNWSKSRFINNLSVKNKISPKLIVIKQSINNPKIDLKTKKKIITFIGKLNSAKGYDLFGKAILKILNKYPEWKSIVIGDEPREKIFFRHKRLKILGFQSHDKVLSYLRSASISVTCSRWNEPFGRSSLEAASRGCAVIISNKGGLPETITDGIILKKLNVNNIFKSIEKVILNKKYRQNLQKLSLKNFFLTNKFASVKIDQYRDLIIGSQNDKNKKKYLKILHVTNLNERHNGRLFYNTGRRINNGLIRLSHNVMTISDRDIVSNNRKLSDIDGSKTLNEIFIKTVDTFNPDLIILGHADLIKKKTIEDIKKNNPEIRVCQWFLDRMDSQWMINKRRFLEKIDAIDASFCTTDPNVLNFNKKNKVFYIPNPVDASFENLKVYENKNPEYDLFFAMSHGVHRGRLKRGKFDQREIFLKKLIKSNPNKKYDFYGFDNTEPLWGDDFKKQIYKSKMALNLSQGKPLKYYSSDRIAQLIGNGLLTFIDEKTKYNDFFSKDEVVFYKNQNDLKKKINFMLKNDKLRVSISKKGRNKYHKYFNSNLVAEYIINKTFNIKKKYYWEKKY